MAVHFAEKVQTLDLRLVGTCNRCGLCCIHREGPDRLICEHLEMHALGQPNGTRCRVYDQRYDCMPIVMYAEDMSGWVPSVCHKDSAMETEIILEKGIGQGCSLTIAPTTP